MRNRLVVLLGVAVLVAASGLVALLWPRAEVSRTLCVKVQLGMTQAEVEAMLGCPPGDYRTGEIELANLVSTFDATMEPWERNELWLGDDGILSVSFDKQNRVVAYEYTPGRRPTFADKVRRWLGL